MLMGCSSGKLRDEGKFDPHGMVHAYLTGGSPLVVSNLWDVTDKDIDRFASIYLRECCAMMVKSMQK